MHESPLWGEGLHGPALLNRFYQHRFIWNSAGNSSAFSISMNQWLAFCNEAGVINTTGQRGTTSGDLQTVFIAVNYEEEKDTQEGEANDDDAMMRCGRLGPCCGGV